MIEDPAIWVEIVCADLAYVIGCCHVTTLDVTTLLCRNN